jgi:general secretion pathway protein N
MIRQLAIGITVVALSVYGGASSSISATSTDTSDDQANGVKSRFLAVSVRADPAAVLQITAPPSPQPAPAVEHPLSANPLWAMPLSKFAVTRERPIFSPSRRPPTPAVIPAITPKAIAVPRPKEPERPRLTLVGTIASDEEGFGIFLDQTSNGVIRLKIGEEFQGWKLRSVQGRETALEKDQQIVTLALPQPGLGTPPPQNEVQHEIRPVGSDNGRPPSKSLRPRPN